jgi:hypothetical protein
MQKLDADVRSLHRLARVLGAWRDQWIGRRFVLFRGNGRRARPTNTDELVTQPMAVVRASAPFAHA